MIIRMETMTKKYAYSGWCALALLAGMSAGAHGKPLTMVGPWEIHSIDPASNGVFFTRLQVAETLVEVDSQGGLQPGLASDWSPADCQAGPHAPVRPSLRRSRLPCLRQRAARPLS